MKRVMAYPASHMSQREDWGYFIISPRGQRIRAMWGQPPHTPQKDYQQDMIAEVPVEPRAGGRFWAIQVGLGDSQNLAPAHRPRKRIAYERSRRTLFVIRIWS